MGELPLLRRRLDRVRRGVIHVLGVLDAGAELGGLPFHQTVQHRPLLEQLRLRLGWRFLLRRCHADALPGQVSRRAR